MQNLLLKSVKIIDSDCRVPNVVESIRQVTTEHDESEALGLERSTNVACLLHEVHIRTWQWKLARLLR